MLILIEYRDSLKENTLYLFNVTSISAVGFLLIHYAQIQIRLKPVQLRTHGPHDLYTNTPSCRDSEAM
jgi:hypothetical protein